jgi:hypothetical protein
MAHVLAQTSALALVVAAASGVLPDVDDVDVAGRRGHGEAPHARRSGLSFRQQRPPTVEQELHTRYVPTRYDALRRENKQQPVYLATMMETLGLNLMMEKSYGLACEADLLINDVWDTDLATVRRL